MTFLRHTKESPAKAWVSDSVSQGKKFRLSHGSIFVLSSDDEIPTTSPTTSTTTRPGLCKFKHGAKFKGAGISVALVFKSLQDEAIAEICDNTNRCHWKKDDKLEPKLRSRVKKKHCPKRKRNMPIPRVLLKDTLKKMKARSVECIDAINKSRR